MLYRLQVKDNIGYLYPANPDNYHYSLPANYYQMLEYGLLLVSVYFFAEHIEEYTAVYGFDIKYGRDVLVGIE